MWTDKATQEDKDELGELLDLVILESYLVNALSCEEAAENIRAYFGNSLLEFEMYFWDSLRFLRGVIGGCERVIGVDMFEASPDAKVIREKLLKRCRSEEIATKLLDFCDEYNWDLQHLERRAMEILLDKSAAGPYFVGDIHERKWERRLGR